MLIVIPSAIEEKWEVNMDVTHSVFEVGRDGKTTCGRLRVGG